MVRVRRSGIRSIPPSVKGQAALCCTLHLTVGDESRPTPGLALFDLPSDDPCFVQAAQQAARLATECYGSSVFRFWEKLREGLESWRSSNARPPHAVSFALALIERAVVDAFCRRTEITLTNAIKENAFQVDLAALCKPLKGRKPSDLLLPATAPINRRSPVTAIDERIPDALLEPGSANRFLVDLLGDVDRDAARLVEMAEQLARAFGRRFSLALQGGEFDDPAKLRYLFERLQADSAAAALVRKIDFVAQPFRPAETLSNQVIALFAEWPSRPPIVIDASNQKLGDLAEAMGWGYAGTVFRASRGIIPSLVDACLLGARREREPVGRWTLADGPVSTAHPFAIQADANAALALGIDGIVVAPSALEHESASVDWIADLRDEHRALLSTPTSTSAFT